MLATETSVRSVDLTCGVCGATMSVPSEARTTTCPYCASPGIVERPRGDARREPSLVVPLLLTRDAAAEAMRQWAKRQGLFRRGDLHRAHVEELRGLYAPCVLYSARATSDYDASIGENYQVTETYTVMVNGKPQTHTRTVTKTEHRPLAGRHAGLVVDVLVTASRGISNPELAQLEPYDLRGLRRYQPQLVAGWIAEDVTRDPAEIAALAREEAVQDVGKQLARFMPGDSHSNLRWQTSLDAEVFDVVLVPVWVLALRAEGEKKLVRVLVNGQTARVVGKAPLSAVRIGLFIGALLLLVAMVALLVGGAAWLAR